MAECSACNKYFPYSQFILLDNREICWDCHRDIKFYFQSYPSHQQYSYLKSPEKPKKPDFIKWIFRSDVREKYYQEMREYEHLKKINEQKWERLINLINNNRETIYDICSFWPKEQPPDWDERRQQIIKRDGGKCQNCGRSSEYLRYKKKPPKHPSKKTKREMYSLGDLDVHHIIPRAKGGTHELSNLISLCRKCHRNRQSRE
jgi:5-methylcytosine-specific restriction endonuclease McrA